MSTGYKIEDPHALYYVTFQVVHWIDIFTRKECRDIIIDNLRYCQNHKGLEIYAFVIMSNHIHLLVGSKDGLLSSMLRDFKSFTTKKIIEQIKQNIESRRWWILRLLEFSAKQHNRNIQYQLWTHENHAEVIYSQKFIRQKVNYIHANPVRAGIVEYEEDFLYSSARSYAGLSSVLDVTVLSL